MPSPYSVELPNLSNPYLATVPSAARASIEVRLPAADAEVWFEGTKTGQTGTDRTFTSPPLTAGVNFTYLVRAKWTEVGRVVDQTREIKVQAGQQVVVDFTVPPGEILPRPKGG